MPTLEAGIYAALITPGSFTQAVIADRLYPLLIPQDAAVPAVAYQRVSGTRIPLYDGASGWARAVVQFSCQARSLAVAKAAAHAIRKDLDVFVGALGGVEIGRAFVVNEADSDELEDAAVTRLDVDFLYQET